MIQIQKQVFNTTKKKTRHAKKGIIPVRYKWAVLDPLNNMSENWEYWRIIIKKNLLFLPQEVWAFKQKHKHNVTTTKHKMHTGTIAQLLHGEGDRK